ncbi:MAG: alpha/beta hydrolase [Spirochaetes bacterium]|nr:MAG: alpha/beta hydrolase [Spirochaetota bacterium]
MKNYLKILIAACALLLLAIAYVWNSGKEARPAIGKAGTVEYGGIVVRYYERGTGDTVVLIPSLGRSESDFNELAGTLSASGFRTVAVELRGVSAGSGLFAKLTHHDYANDAAAVIRNIGADGKVHVVGHAFGNRIARTLASDHPGTVRSLILIAAGGYVPIPDDIRKAMYICFFNFLPDRVRGKYIRKAFFAPGAADIPEYWVSGWYFRAAWPQSRATLATPREEWWAGGNAPILVLQGANDAIAPAENADAMKREFGDRVSVVRVPTVGHAMLPERPDLIAKSIVSYLRAH